MVSTFLRDPQALSSTLASLGMLQPRAFRSLKMRRDLAHARPGHTYTQPYVCIIYNIMIIMVFSMIIIMGCVQRALVVWVYTLTWNMILPRMQY